MLVPWRVPLLMGSNPQHPMKVSNPRHRIMEAAFPTAEPGVGWLVFVPGVEYGLIVVMQMLGCFISVIPAKSCWKESQVESMDVYLSEDSADL